MLTVETMDAALKRIDDELFRAELKPRDAGTAGRAAICRQNELDE